MSEKEIQFGDVEFYLCDTLDIYIDNGTSYDNPGDKKVCIDKPDAIDLGKRLLEHFDVLPTKGEIEACDIIETLLQDEINRYDAAGKDVPEWFHQKRAAIDATIAKLRCLVAEEWERRVEGQDTE